MRSLTVNDGLPQGQVRGMVQDKQGFMWIASEGLSRYDGRSFLNFTHVYGAPATIASNGIHELEIDDADSLWLAYDNKEIDVINSASGRVRHISAEPAFRWMVPPLDERIGIRQAGKRLYAVNSRRLIAFDSRTGRHWPVVLPAGERIVALGGKTNKALLATDAALYEIKETTLHKIVSFPQLSDSVRADFNRYMPASTVRLGKIIPFAQQELVFITPGGLAVYNEQTASCRYHEDLLSVPHSLTQAPDGSLYYINKKGICKFDGSKPAQLSFVNTVFSRPYEPLLADRSGMLWAGALVQGLRLYDLQPANFHSLPIQQGFAMDVIGKWIPDNPLSVNFNSYALRTAKDTAGSIWLFNHSDVYEEAKRKIISGKEGFYRFDGSKLDKFPFYDTGCSIHGFTFDSRNQCWLLVLYGRLRKMVLAKASLARHTIQPFATLPFELSSENRYLTAVDGKIAALQEHTLRLYDTATAACTIYLLEKLGIGGTLLMALPDRQQHNILWIATKGSGIVKLNVTTGATQHYTEAEGLPNNVVYFIAPDKRGFFWCSSNKGLFRFNPANGSIVAFTVKDGLQGNEFNRYHFLETPDGHFWFGGTEGHTVFHPDSIYLDNYETPAAITEVQVNNIPLQQLAPEWNQSITSSLPQLTLAYNQNYLGFSFAGLQYNNQEKLQYRYRLEEIDKDWVYAGHDATAKYASLPPGHYLLKVNASNTAGKWSSHIKTLHITITPPWWRTWWAYLIYCLLTAGVIYALYRNWLHRAQTRQQVILKQKEAEQAHALEETKSRFFANITHELRTPLTLILSPVQRQLQEGATTWSPQLLQGVYQNSQTLLRLINQLLDMSKVEGGRMPVNLHRGNVVRFIESLLPPFQQQAIARHIRFSFLVNAEQNGEEHHFDDDPPSPAPVRIPIPPRRENTPAPRPVVEKVDGKRISVPADEGMNQGEGNEAGEEGKEYLFDSDKLEKVLYNLLSNAFKFTPDGGEISLSVREQCTGDRSAFRSLDKGTENQKEQNIPIHSSRLQPVETGDSSTVFRIQVSDSGIGIAPEHLPHIFDRFYQVNTSTTRRYEGTGIGLSLVKEFVDLMSGTIQVESTPGCGSVFTLTLPLVVATGKDVPVINHFREALHPAAGQEKVMENELPAPDEKPLILIADDNEGLRHFIAASLAPYYRVLTAVNGEAGLQTAIAELPELIISDVMMPLMDGYEFCQRVKENLLTSHTGFILLTSKTADENRVSGLRLGADHYLNKPFMVEELLLVIRNLLLHQQKLREHYSHQINQPAEKLPPVKEVADEFLQMVYNIIEINFDNDRLDVDFLAGEMAVSRRTLNRKLTAIADTSANEIIRNYRLKKAADLLLSGQGVSEAAYATGFSTPSYFSQCFREMYGQSPGQWVEKSN